MANRMPDTPPPIVVAVVGPPQVGKSTLIRYKVFWVCVETVSSYVGLCGFCIGVWVYLSLLLHIGAFLFLFLFIIYYRHTEDQCTTNSATPFIGVSVYGNPCVCVCVCFVFVWCISLACIASILF